MKDLFMTAVGYLADWLSGASVQPDQDSHPLAVYNLLHAEVTAINSTLAELGIDAGVELCDVTVSSVAGYIRYRIATGSGTRISRVKQVTDDLAIAINDCRRNVPGAQAVTIQWRDGQSFELPYPFERKTLHWDRIAAVKALRPFQIIIGRNYQPEQPTTEAVRLGLGGATHIFVGGGTGSGKTGLINCAIASLCTATPPDKLHVVVINPKKCKDLLLVAGFPHVTMHTEVGACVAAMQAVHAELLRRQDTGETEPKIVLVVEEMSHLARLIGGKEVIMDVLNGLGNTARSAGIHIIASTQYPNKNTVDREFMVNFDVKVCGRFSGTQPYRQVLDLEDFTGAVLPGNGSFYVNIGDEVKRVQCPFMYGDEMQAVVDAVCATWRNVEPCRPFAVGAVPGAVSVPLAAPVAGDDGDKYADEVKLLAGAYQYDELFTEAGKLLPGVSKSEIVRTVFGKEAKTGGGTWRKLDRILEGAAKQREAWDAGCATRLPTP